MEKNKSVAKQYNNAKLWQIGFFSLNNCATNIAMFLMMQYSYFTQNVLGLAAAIVGLIATGTRIFDAVTDPLVGFLVDRTNGRFGKFRPYMLVGNIIIWCSLIVIFNTPSSWGISRKYIFTTVFYVIYIIGYTCQTVVTKAGQAVLTNNPKQRPIFAGFDSVLTQMASALVPMLITTILAEKYSVGEFVGENGKGLGMINPAMWKEAVIILAVISFVFTILAIIGISAKDRPEFFGQAGSQPKVKFRDYKDIVMHNRPIQMLIISGVIAFVLGLFLGVLLIVTKSGGIMANPVLYKILDKIIDVIRSIPFIILMVLLIPVSRALVGTGSGVTGSYVALIAGTVPFFARQIESVLADVDYGLVEASASMGFSPLEIIFSVYLKESIPGITRVTMITFVSLIGITAMAGAIGAGGLGDFAIRYGYQMGYRDMIWVTVIIILIIISVIQGVGNLIIRRTTH